METETRINERIRASQVRLVGSDGQQVGIMTTEDALAKARDEDLDLVEVAPQADPPVARLMDYGKWKYEQEIKNREARKRQTHVVVKEMRYRPKISQHDFDYKTRNVTRFLESGFKVKVVVWFRGREMAHPELGEQLLERLANQLEEVGFIETPAKRDGRNMLMVLAPVKNPGAKTSEESG